MMVKVMNTQKKHKHSGFTIVEAVMIIVVIAVLTGIGYIVYQRRSAVPATLDNSKDAQKTEEHLYKEGENLDKQIDEDTAKLDQVTKEVQ